MSSPPPPESLSASGKTEELVTLSTAEQLVTATVTGELVRERRPEQILHVFQLICAGPRGQARIEIRIHRRCGRVERGEIVTDASEDDICTSPTVEDVGVSAAVEDVLTSSAIDRVDPAESAQNVVAEVPLSVSAEGVPTFVQLVPLMTVS